MYKDSSLHGVNVTPLEQDVSLAKEMTLIQEALLREGVKFRDSAPDQVPWLQGVEPFRISEELKGRLDALGNAFYRYFNWLQRQYPSNQRIADSLDVGVLPDLRVTDTRQPLETFRLDIVMHQGRPVATEFEEVYGNAGKLHAMDTAYGGGQDKLFAAFAALNLTHIVVDDTVEYYFPELEMLVSRLARSYEQHVKITLLSEWDPAPTDRAWRFCYVKDYSQYAPEKRQQLLASQATVVNGNFHGYGAKTALALIHDHDISQQLIRDLGAETYECLRNGCPESYLLNEQCPFSLDEIVRDRKSWVLRVADCRENQDLNWGARGVFFGDTSSKKWRRLVANAFDGFLETRDGIKIAADFMLSRLIDSDKFDVKFWNQCAGEVQLMEKARIRLGPIYFREYDRAIPEDRVNMVGGHATFVNTSRKVHLGKHSVCVPVVVLDHN